MNLFSLLGVGFQIDPLEAPPGGGGGTTPTAGLPSFDQLTLSGVSPNVAEYPVPMSRIRKKIGAPEPWSGAMAETDEMVLDTLTYQQAVMSFAKQDPATMTEKQLDLAAAGFMGKNPNVVFQAYDTVTDNAWKEVLKAAALSGRPVDEIIEEAIEENGGREEGLKKHGISRDGVIADKNAIRLTHPDDIRMTAAEVSRKVLGMSWSKEQLDSFVRTYQAQETAEGQASAGDGAYTAAASMEAAAAAQARRSNPAQAGATDWVNAGNMLIEAFKTLGGGGAAANG